MRVVFMGTPQFACVTLRALRDSGHEIICVYSQPPRPAGRGYALKKSPVHGLAESWGVEVRTPASLRSEEDQRRFAALSADAAVVVAYGLILPKPILDAPGFGCFNVHASLLPRWRGAAPVQRAIMAGDRVTGVSIMRMDVGLDTGAVLKTESVAINPETTAGMLHDRLALTGARAMVDVLANPGATGTAQSETGVTYAAKIAKEEARIDFRKPAEWVRNHIHGLSPFPGAWLSVRNTRIKVLLAETTHGSGEPGAFMDDSLAVACGSGAIRLLKLQREGKAAATAAEFLRGFQIKTGTKAD